MASKLERISALSTETTRHLTDTPETWMRFLDSAAWFYKYSFADQVLIAAQRPDATACAELELWNRVCPAENDRTNHKRMPADLPRSESFLPRRLRCRHSNREADLRSRFRQLIAGLRSSINNRDDLFSFLGYITGRKNIATHFADQSKLLQYLYLF